LKIEKHEQRNERIMVLRIETSFKERLWVVTGSVIGIAFNIRFTITMLNFPGMVL
jgi:hypothetical protein